MALQGNRNLLACGTLAIRVATARSLEKNPPPPPLPPLEDAPAAAELLEAGGGGEGLHRVLQHAGAKATTALSSDLLTCCSCLTSSWPFLRTRMLET